MSVARGTPRGARRAELCGLCSRAPARPGQWDCRACHAEAMRGYRADQAARIRALEAELAARRQGEATR